MLHSWCFFVTNNQRGKPHENVRQFIEPIADGLNLTFRLGQSSVLYLKYIISLVFYILSYCRTTFDYTKLAQRAMQLKHEGHLDFNEKTILYNF